MPVRDAEGLRWDLDSYIEETEEVGDGIYRVTGTESGKQLYARLSSDWIYVADNQADLADVASDPAALLGGLDKKYDAALCVETRNIPEKEGRAIINLLGEKFGSVIREHVSDHALNFLGEALRFRAGCDGMESPLRLRRAGSDEAADGCRFASPAERTLPRVRRAYSSAINPAGTSP